MGQVNVVGGEGGSLRKTTPLSGELPQIMSSGETEASVGRVLRVENEKGIHAKPAAVLALFSSFLDSRGVKTRMRKTWSLGDVDASDNFALMGLAVPDRRRLVVRVSGNYQKERLSAVLDQWGRLLADTEALECLIPDKVERYNIEADRALGRLR